MDREMFAPQAEALSPEYRVITWDERGFGETEFDGQPFTYWDSAKDCLALLDHLGIEEAVVGGMSQGGFVSLRAALGSAPERVRALVLIDTQSGGEDPERLPAYRQMQETWLTHGPVDELTQAISALIIGDPVVSEAWIAKWRELPREAMMEPTETLFTRDDITDRVGEITCPAIVFHGNGRRVDRDGQSGGVVRGASGLPRVGAHRRCAARVEPDPRRTRQRATARVSARDLAPLGG